MATETMRIGEVAVRAGVHIQTLRFYERRGLLQAPHRQRSGYREYPPEAVQIVRFIKRAQDIGFTLSEIQELLRLRDREATSCPEVRAAAESKIADIDERIRRLKAMKGALNALAKSCGTAAATRECPLLRALDRAPGLSPLDAPGTASPQRAAPSREKGR